MPIDQLTMLSLAAAETVAPATGTPAAHLADINLWMVCLNAFAAVVVLLSLLAVIMRALLWLLPEQPTTPEAIEEPEPSSSDAAMVAGIVTAATAAVPGGRVTHIHETTR